MRMVGKTKPTRRSRARHALPSKRRLWAGNLIQNAVALMVSSGGSAVLGVIFWATAARLTTAQNVGRASAEIAAMVLLANLSQLSFTTIFDRFLPVAGDRTFRFVTHAVRDVCGRRCHCRRRVRDCRLRA